MTTKELTPLAEELNTIFFKPGDPQRVNLSKIPALEDQKKAVVELCKLLQTEDPLSEPSRRVLKGLLKEIPLNFENEEEKTEVISNLTAMGLMEDQEEKEQEDVPPAVELPSLQAEIANPKSTLQELKEIAKANDEFKDIRGRLSSYKNAFTLRADLLKALKNPSNKNAKPAPAPAPVLKEEKPAQANKKTPPTPPAKEYDRIDSICEVIKTKKNIPDLDFLANASNALYVSKGAGKDNIKESRTIARMIIKALKHFDIHW